MTWSEGKLLIPFIHILSPKCASPRMSPASPIVNEVPFPPPSVLSSDSSAVTAMLG